MNYNIHSKSSLSQIIEKHTKINVSLVDYKHASFLKFCLVSSGWYCIIVNQCSYKNTC